jgi:hypothetical protein
VFALMPHKQAALFCLHTYWILDGNVHKYCFHWVNISLMIGWRPQSASIRWKGGGAIYTVMHKLGWAVYPASHPCPQVFAFSSPKTTCHDSCHPRGKETAMALITMLSFSVLLWSMLLYAHLELSDCDFVTSALSLFSFPFLLFP